jgi:hypothetical protein
LLNPLLPILKDEQLLEFCLHARMLWADRSAVNRWRLNPLQSWIGSDPAVL